MIDRAAITGLVLAGGRGVRMGGLDKGLQRFGGTELALRAALRLSSQVSRVAISANRHLDRYAVFGFDVWPDDGAHEFAGPLAGILAGLDHCDTDWLATVPCDTPHFPLDIVERLAYAAHASNADVATAASGDEARPQPAFCLINRRVRESLHAHVTAGGRKVLTWIGSTRHAAVTFDDEASFFNANTLTDLSELEGREPKLAR